jgi:hypothetical protein
MYALKSLAVPGAVPARSWRDIQTSSVFIALSQ